MLIYEKIYCTFLGLLNLQIICITQLDESHNEPQSRVGVGTHRVRRVCSPVIREDSRAFICRQTFSFSRQSDGILETVCKVFNSSTKDRLILKPRRCVFSLLPFLHFTSARGSDKSVTTEVFIYEDTRSRRQCY